MMHDVAPNARRVATLGQEENRRKGDTKLGEIRITYYIAMNPIRLRKVTSSVQVCGNEMIGCCTIRRISRIYLHARLTKPTHHSKWSKGGFFLDFATVPDFDARCIVCVTRACVCVCVRARIEFHRERNILIFFARFNEDWRLFFFLRRRRRRIVNSE